MEEFQQMEAEVYSHYRNFSRDELQLLAVKHALLEQLQGGACELLNSRVRLVQRHLSPSGAPPQERPSVGGFVQGVRTVLQGAKQLQEVDRENVRLKQQIDHLNERLSTEMKVKLGGEEVEKSLLNSAEVILGRLRHCSNFMGEEVDDLVDDDVPCRDVRGATHLAQEGVNKLQGQKPDVEQYAKGLDLVLESAKTAIRGFATITEVVCAKLTSLQVSEWAA
ncbi:hypothetical protein CYMTET_40906 [Cymbomonas tetramitiformis]|uniref:Uncharacterized protein n=1 Tax=Cymbomonas tetramitiformis TaxID=36881 RepID=A0AAE0C757_9CHLO|nr:hypothetical protein CYMTET_40906 [Cymbomonas tetramitiformis]